MNFLKPKYLLLLIVLITTSIVQSQSNTVLVDFGNADSLSPEPWNNLTNSFNGEILNLKNITGAETGIKIRVDDPFSNVNTNGTNSPDSSLGFPGSATVDSFFGNALEFGGKIEEEGAVTLSNLDVSVEYTISLFGSRMGVSDNRETKYMLEGIENKTLYLDTSSNTTNSVVASVKPNVDGTIIIRVSAGPNNNNSKGFFYLGAMKLDYSSTGTGSSSDSSVWSANGPTIFYDQGPVGIATQDVPQDYELAVGGKIIAEELLIKLQNNWPDYVFDKEYQLPSLREVAKYIKEKGHLMNIPSETEVAENGIQLGEMNAKLLEKIEELTLYTIAQENRIEQQQLVNEKLEARLKAIEASLQGSK